MTPTEAAGKLARAVDDWHESGDPMDSVKYAVVVMRLRDWKASRLMVLEVLMKARIANIDDMKDALRSARAFIALIKDTTPSRSMAADAGLVIAQIDKATGKG